MKYEIIEQQFGAVLKRTDKDGKVWWIPINEGNIDYQQYLRWLENPSAEEFGTIS